MMLNKSDKIYVAGHRGLVGGAIVDALKTRGYDNLVLRTHRQLDLEDQAATKQFFTDEKPDVVFLAAAKVGGIHANNTYRADFIFKNLQIQNNVIWSAHEANVRRLIFLGSSCIYPKQALQPMPEDCLLTGPLEITNRPYALAKIAGLELIQNLRQQYSRDYFSVMPTNLYGPRDNFHPEDSHVLPALIRRFCEAKQNQSERVVIWGSGKPQREFMYSSDCADAIVHLAENLSFEQLKKSAVGQAGWSHVNVGTGQEVTIRELAEKIGELTGYKGQIDFDTNRPDGTLRKLLNTEFLHSLGWQSSVSLEKGLRSTIDWYASQDFSKERGES